MSLDHHAAEAQRDLDHPGEKLGDGFKIVGARFNPDATEQSRARAADRQRRARRTWIKPGGLVGVGAEGRTVECMSYEEDPTGLVNVRMIPGEAVSARVVPAAGLARLTIKRMQAEADHVAQAIENVAGVRAHVYMDASDCPDAAMLGQEECDNPSCWLCTGTLGMCRVCRQAEAELEPTCPGPKVDAEAGA